MHTLPHGRPVVDVPLPGDRPPPAPATKAPAPARVAPRRAPRRTGTGHPNQIPVCACQLGPTTHCHHGNHQACQGPAHTVTTCETHLTYADSTCVMDGGDPVEVWLADRTCQWTCACTCHTTTAAHATWQPALF